MLQNKVSANTVFGMDIDTLSVVEQQKLKVIKQEDLLFGDNDSCTNTVLNLSDYDWMDYSLTTKFKTKEQGVLYIKFNYCGTSTSFMYVEQVTEKGSVQYNMSYATDIFEKYILQYLKLHTKQWEEHKGFNGEPTVIDFFNEVIEKGRYEIVNCIK